MIRWILTCAAAVVLLAVTPARAQDDEATRHAAEQGDADAQSTLGFMYENGRGVPQDDAEAVRWYRLAAEQGNSLAQNNLGFMYGNGRGVPAAHRARDHNRSDVLHSRQGYGSSQGSRTRSAST